MYNILVFIYSYKNKNLFSIYEKLNIKSSKNNNIFFYICDQNNENKKDKYANLKNVKYNHIFWDSRSSISEYRKIALQNNFDYFFEVGNLEEICDNWDDIFIKNNKIKILKKDTNSNLSTIFVNKKYSHILKNLYPLKYYGEYFYFLYLLYKTKINFDFFNKDDILLLDDPILYSDYVPYSLNHNYNKIFKIFKENIGFKKFLLNYKINLDNFKYLVNQVDDVLYKNLTYNIDVLSTDRYSAPTNILKSVKS